MAFAMTISPIGSVWRIPRLERRRRCWARAWSGLIDLECRETRADLRRAIEAILSDAARPGAPEAHRGASDPDPRGRLQPPEKSGRPITHWTAHGLADSVVKRGIVASIRRPRWAAPPRGGHAAPRSRIGSTPPRRTRAVSPAGRDGLRHDREAPPWSGPGTRTRLRGRDDGDPGLERIAAAQP